MELSLKILIFFLWTLLLLEGLDLFIIFDVSVHSLTGFIALFLTTNNYNRAQRNSYNTIHMT